MDKNIKTIHAGSEEDLFKILNSLGIFGGTPIPSPVKDGNANAAKEPAHTCSCGGNCANKAQSLEDISSLIYSNKNINMVFNARNGENIPVYPVLNQFNISDFIDAVNDGDEDAVYILLGSAGHIAIPLDMISDLIHWLSAVKKVVETDTQYFTPVKEMSHKEIEKILGYKFTIRD